MKTRFITRLAFIPVFVFAILFAGCESGEGLGEDLENLGEEVEDAAEELN